MNSTVIYWPQLIGIVVFLTLNGLLVACELSLIKLRFSHFNPELLDRLREDKTLGRFLDDADRTVRVIRFGTTLCILGFGLFLFPIVYQGLMQAEVNMYGLITPASWLLAFLLSTALHYLVAELFARSLALAFPLPCLHASAPVVRVFSLLTHPFIVGLNRVSQWLLLIFGIRNPGRMESLDMEAQIEMLKTDAPEISDIAQTILKNALLLRDLVVADVLLPRNQVQFFDMHASVADNLKMAKETGHTRFPLCLGDLDRCIGLIHIKDIFRSEGDQSKVDFRKIRREIIRVDAEEPLEEALSKLLKHRMHMALVIDEFRGAEGVLTLERILEELVGDIQDEFDSDEEVFIQPSTHSGEAIVAGLTPLHEIEEQFGVVLESDDVSTLSGLITTELGRIPEAGEELKISNLKLTVVEVDETRVIQVHIKVVPAEDSEAEEVTTKDEF